MFEHGNEPSGVIGGGKLLNETETVCFLGTPSHRLCYVITMLSILVYLSNMPSLCEELFIDNRYFSRESAVHSGIKVQPSSITVKINGQSTFNFPPLFGTLSTYNVHVRKIRKHPIEELHKCLLCLCPL